MEKPVLGNFTLEQKFHQIIELMISLLIRKLLSVLQ